MAVISRLPQGGGISENELECGIGVWQNQEETPASIIKGHACIYNGEIHWFSGSSHYVGISATEAVETLPQVLQYCCSVNGIIYAILNGGIYKYAEGAWTLIISIPLTPAYYNVCYDNENLYYWGYTSSSFKGTYKFSFIEETLTQLSETYPSNYNQRGNSFCVNGILHCVGGSSSTYYTYHYIFNATDGTWTRIAQTIKVNQYATACVYSGYAYIVMQDLNTSLGHVCYRYDGNEWIAMPAPPLFQDTSSSTAWKAGIYNQALLIDDDNLWLFGGGQPSYLMNYKAKLIEYREAGKEK